MDADCLVQLPFLRPAQTTSFSLNFPQLRSGHNIHRACFKERLLRGRQKLVNAEFLEISMAQDLLGLRIV